MKLCKHCYIEKPLTEFRPQRAECRDCLNLRRRLSYEKNPTKKIASSTKYANAHKPEKKEYNDSYRETNREQINAQKRQHYQDNKEVISEKNRLDYWNNRETKCAQKEVYRKANPDKINARNRKRILAQKNRVPKWLTKADFIEIEWAYTLAKEITKETGIKHVVDHIIPLQGKHISGLHCSQNLRIITAKENNIKKNKFPYIKG